MTRVPTPDEIHVIRERHFGWERATFSTLAAIFDVHVNTIAAICRRKPTDTRTGVEA